MEEKIDREYRMQCAQLIGEITALAFMVNTFTTYCVFMDYAGHVELFKVQITADSSHYTDVVTQDEVRIDAEKWDEESTIQQLINLKSQLRKILLEKKIKYDGLRYTVREERDYHLI